MYVNYKQEFTCDYNYITWWWLRSLADVNEFYCCPLGLLFIRISVEPQKEIKLKRTWLRDKWWCTNLPKLYWLSQWLIVYFFLSFKGIGGTLLNGLIGGIGSAGQGFGGIGGGYGSRCPLCDSSVFEYCSHKLLHDACCCNGGWWSYNN